MANVLSVDISNFQPSRLYCGVNPQRGEVTIAVDPLAGVWPVGAVYKAYELATKPKDKMVKTHLK